MTSAPYHAALSYTPPLIHASEVGMVAVTEFLVDGRTQQQALIEASARAWATLAWPATLRGITWLTSLDGTRALAYAQWTDHSQFGFYALTHRPILVAAFRAAVPGVAVAAPTLYHPYRGARTPDAPPPGVIVIVQVEFDGPNSARQRSWIDAVFAALASAPPPPGGQGALFHASLDGTRVLNYAEWADEASHQAALDASNGESIGTSHAWRKVQTFPGVATGRFTRYRFDRRLVPVRNGGDI